MNDYQISYDPQGRPYLQLVLRNPNELPKIRKESDEESERGVIIINMFDEDEEN